MKELSSLELDELAADAKQCLVSKGFNHALDTIMQRNIQTLCTEPVGSLTANQAHASMKALTDLRGELQSLINSETIRNKGFRK